MCSVVQKVEKPHVTIAPTANFPNAPQAGNRLVAILGTLHDDVVTVSPGWDLRVSRVDEGGDLYIYERVADGGEPDAGIAFTLVSKDGTSLVLYELAGPLVPDAEATNTSGARYKDPETGLSVIPKVTTLSTGTAENVAGILALGIIYRTETHGETDEPIGGWTNDFLEESNFKCCGNVHRSRIAIATKALSGAGPVETSASWVTPVRACGAILTYASGS